MRRWNCRCRWIIRCAMAGPPGWRSDGALCIGMKRISTRMFVVDHAVVEAGGLDDPRDAARRELLEPGPKRGPPLAHRPPYAVFFHASYEAPIARQRIPNSPCNTSSMTLK